MARIPGEYLWVFNGARSSFPSGVFSSVEKAEIFIRKYAMTGILTAYPKDELAYEWAIENSLFEPKKEEHRSPEFIQKFTTASQEHYHYENGVRE
jgi:hypothetical protein